MNKNSSVISIRTLLILVLPTWIPEGYILIDSSSPAGRNGIVQAYMKDNQLLWVRVFDYDPNFVGGYSKDENPVEVYRSNGIDYYLLIPVAVPLSGSPKTENAA